MKLEGLHRHASTHAAGIVIGDRPLAELVPMYRDPKSDMPVTQFNMKWVEQRGAGEVRLPRPEDAERARDRGEARRAARHRSRSARASRSTTPRATRCSSRGETVGVFQVEGQGMRRALHGHAPRPFRGHHRAGRALSPGPDGEHPDLLRAQARQGAARIHSSQARAGAARDLRRHRLSGTGDGGRAAALRLLARRSRPAAPRDGQEDPHRDGGAAQALRRRRGSDGVEKGQAEAIFELLAQVCRLRLQQEPRGGLRAGRLPDRLHEGELSGRVPGRVDDLRHGEYRQALGIPRRGACALASRSSRRRSIARAWTSTSRETRSTMRSRRSKAWGARR